MNRTGVQRALAAFVLTLLLVLVGFTVGLAQGTPALGALLTAELNRELPGGTVQLHHCTSLLGLASETGGLPSNYKYREPCHQDHVLRLRLELDNQQSSACAQIPSHKVSLHVLQSVFLL